MEKRAYSPTNPNEGDLGFESAFQTRKKEVDVLKSQFTEFISGFARESIIPALKQEMLELENAGLLHALHYDSKGDLIRFEGDEDVTDNQLKVFKIDTSYYAGLDYFVTTDGIIVALPMTRGLYTDPSEHFLSVDDSIYPFLFDNALKDISRLYEFEAGSIKNKGVVASIFTAKADELTLKRDEVKIFQASLVEDSVKPALIQEAQKLSKTGIFPTHFYIPNRGIDWHGFNSETDVPIDLANVEPTRFTPGCYITPEGSLIAEAQDKRKKSDPTEALYELQDFYYLILAENALEALSEQWSIAEHNERFAKEREKISA